MRFGSVAFFKVLIKTVLCIAFFVPLVLCVIFAVVLWNKSAQLEQMQNNTSLVEELQHENAVLSSKVELLSGKSSTVEDFYKLYADSGLGCGAFKIKCLGFVSIGILLCAGFPHKRYTIGLSCRFTALIIASVNCSQPFP